jgi:transcription antitermination factor NusG
VFFLVESNGRPCPIPTHEIETIRRVVECGISAQNHPFISAGDRVRIRSGSLAGITGLLTRFKNQYRIVLAVDLLRKAVSIEVEIDNVEPIRNITSTSGGQKTLATSA